MSRYYQSSYHGSNDYKKYREERLAKNPPTTIINDKLTLASQISSYRPQSRRNHQPKEHLQTFGIQLYSEQTKSHLPCDGMHLNSKEGDWSRRQESSRFEESSFLPKRPTNFDYDQSKPHDDKFSRYMKDAYGADKRSPLLNEEPRSTGTHGIEPYQSSRGYSRPRDAGKNIQVSTEEFQDSIIIRRRNYDHLKDFGSESCIQAPSKTYNYSCKLRNLPEQKPIERRPVYETKLEEKYRPISDLVQKTPSTSPYRGRNQIIREKLTINQNPHEPLYEKGSYQSGFQPGFRSFIPAEIKTAHVTPQKSPLNSRQEKNLSQQRRKSLIQKSQMLKEKLSKLNGTSNTKGGENEESTSRQGIAEKENMVHNYTPKRYMTNSFRVQGQELERMDGSVSKRLNFDENVSRNEHVKRSEKVDKSGSEIKYGGRGGNSSSRSGLVERKSQVNMSSVSGQGALRKISELNDRINSRLEQILKNYG